VWLAVGRGARFDLIDPPAVDANGMPLRAASVVIGSRLPGLCPVEKFREGDVVLLSEGLGPTRVRSVHEPTHYPRVRVVVLANRPDIPELTLPADATYLVTEARREVLVRCQICGRSCLYTGNLATATPLTFPVCTACDARITAEVQAAHDHTEGTPTEC
jgi:hypothetical protein